MSKPKVNKDRHLQTVTAEPIPLNSHAPLQQVPPSPPHEDEPMQQAGTVEVIIPASVVQEQLDVVDFFLEKTNEENASLKQQAPVNEIDEEIEVEKADSLSLRTSQAEPSEPNKEENDKIEGTLNASREKTTPGASCRTPTQMDVDTAPLTGAP